MYDVENLEERWKIYKSKQRVPLYIFAIITLLIGGYAYYFQAINSSVKSYMDENNITLSFKLEPMQSPKNVAHIEESNTTQKVVEKNDLKIEVDDPELMESAQKEHQRKYIKIEVTDENGNKATEDNQQESDNEDIFNKDEKSFQDNIRTAKESFLKTKNYEDALVIARLYYDSGRYLEAEKWALVSNNIDNTIEEGWFIFVKSKVMIGDIQEAKDVLKVYIEKTDSEDAKKLLIDIENNKL